MIRVRDGQTIHVTRTANRHGINSTPDTDAGTITGCTISGPRNTRSARTRAEVWSQDRYLFCPSTADVQTGDRFKIDGTGATYRVIGQDTPGTSALTGRHFGLKCWLIEATQ